MPKNAGVLCRSADYECDLPEYCTGQSEFCPSDVYKMDTEVCDNGKVRIFKKKSEISSYLQFFRPIATTVSAEQEPTSVGCSGGKLGNPVTNSATK